MILGVSYGFHDAGVTLINEKEILFAGHTERFSKHKHDNWINKQIFEEAFNYGTPSKIIYYENPWNKKLRQAFAGQWDDALQWPRVKTNLRYFTGCNVPVYYADHHESHAAAGFATSPFQSAAVVVVDAIGEWDTMSIWQAEEDEFGDVEYVKLWSNKYPHSIGLMYSAFTQRVGLKPLDEEYILMGMSAFGDGKLSSTIKKDLISDPRRLKFSKNMHLGIEKDYLKDSKDTDIAAGVQVLTEELLSHVFILARQLTGESSVVFMGGVALNCVANRNIGKYFEDIWIMPNPGDAGSSLGAAALTYGGRVDWQHPYLGEEIKGEYPVNQVLETLLDTGICGVASGRAEFGPRALGNRSLLADPRSPGMKDRVNNIKRRQQFRPFGPAILSEQVENYYDMPVGWQDSPYMQVIARVQSGKKIMKGIEYPAVIHADGTTRVQTVDQHMNPGFRALLEKWFIITDCPILLNTSLNIRGEPMVNNRADADRFTLEYGVPVWS